MNWKLTVGGYGKIERCEIEVAPLTLFVGDNNSGKSYLMSLLWGIKNLGIQALIGKEAAKESDAENRLRVWIREQIGIALKQGEVSVCADGIAADLQTVLSERMHRKKDAFVQKIFNSPNMVIREFQIELQRSEKMDLYFNFNYVQNETALYIYGKDSDRFRIIFAESEKNVDGLSDDAYAACLEAMYCILLDMEPIENGHYRHLYLPAARTGFILTKDTINKVSRNAMFNMQTEKEEMVPFVRPINQFLDVLNDLSWDVRENRAFEPILAYLESGMADGFLEMRSLPNKEISYTPNGSKTGMPLRMASAVVTELSPLILMLKHKENLNTLFYEEPEVCLHPQLQHSMAKVICRLVNTGLNLIVTTHSDIILQHINNMIRLFRRDDAKDICEQYGYAQHDMMSPEKIKVYQFTKKDGSHTDIEELICGENGFAIPSFNHALDRILNEAYAIQG